MPVYSDPKLWKKIKPLAREKRHEPTYAESLLWQHLRGHSLNGAKFRRQHPIGRFIVDFYCASAYLVIEVDGAIHTAQVEEDAARQAEIEQQGLHVLRFRNEEVIHHMPRVLAAIEAAIAQAGNGRAEPE